MYELQPKDPLKTEENFEKIMRENCSMFHYMQSYSGRTKSFRTDDKTNLASKVMGVTCPFTFSHIKLY